MSKNCVANKKPVTRRQTDDPIIGQPSDFSTNVLPTSEDVLKYFEWTRKKVKEENTAHPKKTKIAVIVSAAIEEIWKTASIPTRHLQSIEGKVLRLVGKLERLKKSNNSKKNAKHFQRNVRAFRTEVLCKLFDVCFCQCPEDQPCSCPADMKVPAKEKPFLKDQRTVRKMVIREVDTRETEKIKKRIARRKSRCRETVEKGTGVQLLRSQSFRSTGSESDCANEVVPTLDESDSDFGAGKIIPQVAEKTVPSEVNSVLLKKKLPVNLSNFARVLDRRGVSDRAGAELASALLEDIAVITDDNLDAVVDKAKIRRERSKARRDAITATRTSDFVGLYFDGRKDTSLITEKKDGVSYQKHEKEEHISMVEEPHGVSYQKHEKEKHISMVEEPGSRYFGHIVAKDTLGKGIAEAMLASLAEKDISTERFRVVGCDGARVNTGPDKGVIRILEERLQRPLQVVICLLHLNELPLRALMDLLDGPTKGPKLFAGPIGKAIENFEKQPVVDFEPIQGNLPEWEPSDLSTDQQYLWEICQAVSTGTCSPGLANRNPGNLSHARWLTLANRILRHYISTEKPSQNLRKLAEYVVRVYAPSWFSIKTDCFITKASKNFHKIIQRCEYLEPNMKKVVHASLKRNGYAAHPEMLLLGMVFDERESVRTFAVSEIEKARVHPRQTVRVFSPPKIDFTAEDYTDLVDWDTQPVTSPPLLEDYSIDELKMMTTCIPEKIAALRPSTCLRTARLSRGLLRK